MTILPSTPPFMLLINLEFGVLFVIYMTVAFGMLMLLFVCNIDNGSVEPSIVDVVRVV